MKPPVYINAFGINCALGNNAAEVAARLFIGDTSGMVEKAGWVPHQTVIVGAVTATLPSIPKALARFASRNNQVLLQAANQIEAQVQQAVARFGSHRVGVVLGTSTTGIAETEHYLADASQAERYCYQLQEQGSPAQFLAAYWQLRGPAWVVSTACSSSARAMIAAKRLLDQGICDAVISGGADTLCKLTLNGFTALEAVSATRCDPFSAHRNGINIGEGAGVFLLSKTTDLGGESVVQKRAAPKSVARFCGGGISMDAHHMSAPDPEGRGAVRAMQAALHEAGITATDIGYVNLHGTATRQNDAMESHAMAQVFPAGVPCSSTKPLTGHALGAASAIEASLCLLALNGANGEGKLPPHIWSGAVDASLPPLSFTRVGQPVSTSNSHNLNNRYMMSNSFAFGGNNVSLIFGHPL